ncbi:saccharopine dehydrogenase family protein [Nocardioides caldifontis]|uniref:saccharopine dehydrogenase family protein n=1 Tax=Nocardioides caldifontis TaxID=2588938 RepID=UPI001EF10FEE|nr:saccharopine dehydrogenase NADP-binding domain-containing protein [Nocardioides caldifontis]
MPEPTGERPFDDERPYDIVLFGATGFTGALTAEYLARNAPEECRWALAGRNPQKLDAAREQLAEIDPRLADLPVLVADVNDADSLRAVARAARVVITTVGPYLEHGEPLVAACAAAGTDYVDLTGEPEFVDRMYVEHHATALTSGARIVHACGFDSIPHDLGVLYTVKQLPAGVPLKVRGVVRAAGMASGGTFASALGQFGRPRQVRQAALDRKQVEPRPEGRKARAVAGRPGKDPDLGYWVLPLPTVDPFVVKRSAAAREDYGPEFTYSHYAGFKQLPFAAGAAVLTGGLVASAQLPPLRRLLQDRLPQGEGPSKEKRERSWFTVDVVGEGGGVKVHTRVSGGDPGYEETARMLAESALCLAFDENPVTAGQVTTAQAMGENLLDRLMKSGISFTVVRTDP